MKNLYHNLIKINHDKKTIVGKFMRILSLIIFVVIVYIIYLIYRMIHNYYKIKKSKDYKIAVGILNNMNYNTPITKHDKYEFSFNLEGFEIETTSNSISVDGVKLELPTQEPLSLFSVVQDIFLPSPSYQIIDKIHVKAEDILTKEKRDNEEMTKKDALISLYKQ